MPIPSFSPIVGTNSEEILDSLEKQRKELQWLLQHLDSKNVKELNAEVINAGRISSKHLKVGSDTEFEEGYDTRALFEVTNDRITLEVEELDSSITTLNIRADGITQSVTNLNNNLSSRITQTAAEIRGEVTAQVTTINNNIQAVRNDVSVVSQTASQIQSIVTSQQTQISGIGNRVSNAESSITQQAYQIQSKVSINDFTGSTIVSKINQDPYSVTIDARKINLNGAVMVNGSISGATSIDVTDNIYIGNTLQIGRYYWETKRINFGGSGGFVSYSNDTIDLSALNGATVNNQYIVTGNEAGLSINWNNQYGTNGRIYFRQNGNNLGYVKFDG